MSTQRVQQEQIKVPEQGQAHRPPTPYPESLRWSIPHGRSTAEIPHPPNQHRQGRNNPLHQKISSVCTVHFRSFARILDGGDTV